MLDEWGQIPINGTVLQKMEWGFQKMVSMSWKIESSSLNISTRNSRIQKLTKLGGDCSLKEMRRGFNELHSRNSWKNCEIRIMDRMLFFEFYMTHLESTMVDRLGVLDLLQFVRLVLVECIDKPTDIIITMPGNKWNNMKPNPNLSSRDCWGADQNFHHKDHFLSTSSLIRHLLQ